jgi:hypothetical protein
MVCMRPLSAPYVTMMRSRSAADEKLHQWVYASHLLTSSKKGISSHQLSRMLGVTYKTAWFMAHRIREAMRPASLTPMGGPDSIIESDETHFGKSELAPKGRIRKRFHWSRNIVLTLVERGGSARSFKVDSAGQDVIWPIIAKNIRRESDLMTDEGSWLAYMPESSAAQTIKDLSGRMKNAYLTADAKDAADGNLALQIASDASDLAERFLQKVDRRSSEIRVKLSQGQ